MKQTDLILKNGVIYTMAREGDVVEALAVRDGKIVYTGAGRLRSAAGGGSGGQDHAPGHG